jgi:hypothetical protein
MPGAGGSQSLENLPPPPVPQHSRAWPAEGSESGRVDIINYLVPLRPVWGGLRKTKCLLSSSAGRPLVAHCAILRRCKNSFGYRRTGRLVQLVLEHGSSGRMTTSAARGSAVL